MSLVNTYYFEEITEDGTLVERRRTMDDFLTVDSSSFNFGQQPFIGTGPQGDEQLLYQTWSQYAQSALGYAEDRIAQLEVRNAELESMVHDARVRLVALELNEISDDAIDTTLLTLISTINDRLTALENN